MKVSKSGNAYGNSQTVTGGGHEHTQIGVAQQFVGSGGGWAATGSEASTSGGGSHSHTFTPSVSDNISVSISSNDSETRPINFTIRIWKRIL